MDTIELIIPPREKDLGGFSVRRILPCTSHQMVGPFIFFDHMGPADFSPGHGIDVRPHPHIHLATVTYLFEGVIRHQDSLGSDQLIKPGDINWMTAGHGIVHSERSPQEFRKTGGKLNGIQLWVALPKEFENVTPSFKHYESNQLPEFIIENVKIKLLIGEIYGRKSPVQAHSSLFYFTANLPKNTSLNFETEACEMGAYIVTGKIAIDNQEVPEHSMAVCKSRSKITIHALDETQLVLIGGKSIGPRFIYWNFVSSSEQAIEQAKKDWVVNGPGEQGSRFPKIKGDDQEFIPLPEAAPNPKPTIM